MYTSASTKFGSLMVSGAGRIKSRLTIAGVELTDDEIKSITLKTGSSDGKSIAPGTVYVPELEAEIIYTGNIYRKTKVCWYIGLSDDGTEYEYVKVFTGTIKNIEKSSDTVKLIVYSQLYYSYKSYISELTYPATTLQMLHEISQKIDMPIETTGLSPITIGEAPKGYTCRQILAEIAGLYGCFVLPNRDDSKIMLKWYENSGLIIRDDFDEPQLEDMNVNIGGFACNVNGKWMTELHSGYVMEWSCMYMTSTILESLRDKLSIKYRIGSFNLLSGNILIDPWDIITLSYNGEEYKMPAGILEHRYDGGLTTAFRTPGDTDGETTSSSANSGGASATDRLIAEVVETKRVLADKADVVELEAVKANIRTLDAEKADINELKAVQATIDNLDATYANIDLSNIAKGTINQAMIATGAIGTAQIADGSITDAKIVELTANKINAGLLSVDRLEIRGSENSIVYAINNITGALQAQNVDTINGEVLTQRSVTADKIVANAITAKEIASKTITANEILSGTITSNEIAANAIQAINIEAGAVTADKINVDSLQAISAKIGGFTIGDTYLANGTDMFGKYEPEMHSKKIDVDVSSGNTFSKTVDMPYCKLPIRITYSITGNSSITNNVSVDTENTEVTVFNVGSVGCTAVYSDGVLTLSGGGYGAKISFTVVWYKDLGGSVYLGLDGISCGEKFSVNANGDLKAASGKISGFDIRDNALLLKSSAAGSDFYCSLNSNSLTHMNGPAYYSVFLGVNTNASFAEPDAQFITPALYIAHNGDLVSTYNHDYNTELRISNASMSMPKGHYITSNNKKMFGMDASGRVKVNYDASCGTDISAASGYSTNFYVGGSQKAYVNSSGISNTSDKRLKTDIEDIEDKYIEIADKLKPKTYKYKDDLSKTNTGFIAQDLQSIIEELGIDKESFAPLSKGDDGYLGINYIQLIPILWAKVQQQDDMIRHLSEEIQKLKGENNGN